MTQFSLNNKTCLQAIFMPRSYNETGHFRSGNGLATRLYNNNDFSSISTEFNCFNYVIMCFVLILVTQLSFERVFKGLWKT